MAFPNDGSEFSGFSNDYQFRIRWREDSQDSVNLTTTVAFAIYLRSYDHYFGNINVRGFLDAGNAFQSRTDVFDTGFYKEYTDPVSGSYSEEFIGSGSFTFQHFSDGTGYMQLWGGFQLQDYSDTFTPSQALYISNRTVNLSTIDVTPPTPAPTFSGSLKNGTAGVEYEDTLTLTNTTSVTSSGLPSGLSASFSSNTNKITVTGTPSKVETKTPSFTATGPGGSTTYNNDSITIYAPQPNFSGSFDDAEQGVEYEDTITISNADDVSVSGLGSNLSYSFSGSTFTLSGTPNTSGSETFTITAENDFGGETSKSYTISIAAPANPTWTDQNIDGPFLVGIPYSDSVAANNATSVTFTGSLPEGLTQSTTSNSCTISGTPQQKATEFEMKSYTFTIAVNGESETSPISKQFTIPLRFPGARINSAGNPEDLKTARKYQDGEWLPINTRAKKFDGSNWQDVDEV